MRSDNVLIRHRDDSLSHLFQKPGRGQIGKHLAFGTIMNHGVQSKEIKPFSVVLKDQRIKPSRDGYPCRQQLGNRTTASEITVPAGGQAKA